jgi:sodium pump decarboxylase gamma subunit
LFGETISLVEGLIVTVLGMLVVFMALIFLMVIIQVMEKVLYRRSGNKADIKVSKVEPAEETKEVEANNPKQQDDLELVAVIAAAIASSMGIQPDDLVIKNIVRLPETAPVWSVAGRLDQMNRRLNR